MRRIRVMAAALGLLAAMGTTVSAQDEGDAAAWFAMMFTPYGALPPMATPGMAGIPREEARARGAFEMKYGRWRFDDGDDYLHTVGLGGRAGALGFVIGYTSCDGCDGVVMGGIDFESVLATSAPGRSTGIATRPAEFTVSLRSGFGLGVATGDSESNAVTATLDLPIALSLPVGTGGHLVPFISPGVGAGRLSGGGEADIGIRAALGVGVGLMLPGGFGAHLGWRKIFLEDAPTTLGLGMSIAR